MARPSKQDQIKSEQAAELARLRAEKKAKAAAQATTLVEEAKPFDAQAEDAQRRSRIESTIADLMGQFELPSWKRVVLGAMTGILLAYGAGWLIGTCIGALIVSAVAFTGVAWIGWVIMMLGIVIAAITGGRIGSSAFGYITDRRIDDDIMSLKNKVTGWFRTPIITQFTGAHQS